MAEDQSRDQYERQGNPTSAGAGQLVFESAVLSKQANPKASEQNGREGTDSTKPVFVKIVGGDELEPFEQQTLAISRKTYWVAVFAFAAAVIAAAFVGVQVKEMTYQTQIFASQSEGANAGALMDEMNTRKQLAIAQTQAKAAQDSVTVIRQQMRIDQQGWVALDNLYPEVSTEHGTQVYGVLKNTGKSPARNIECIIGLFFKHGPEPPTIVDGKWMEMISNKVAIGAVPSEAALEQPTQSDRADLRWMEHLAETGRITDPTLFPRDSALSIVSAPARMRIGVLAPQGTFPLKLPVGGNWSMPGTFVVIAYGTALYTDTFGGAHNTRFCRFLRLARDTQFSPCTVNNDMK